MTPEERRRLSFVLHTLLLMCATTMMMLAFVTLVYRGEIDRLAARLKAVEAITAH